jgi:hypothetical protein
MAKFHEAWRSRPTQVALAGEKNFAAFMAALDDDPSIVPDPLDATWYRTMIAKVIVFRAVESMIKTKEAKDIFRQGWVNITTYVIAMLSQRLHDDIDFEMIWQAQDISKPLRNMLWDWAKVVNNTFEQVARGGQFSEVAKRADTWTKVQSATFSVPQGVPEIRGPAARAATA